MKKLIFAVMSVLCLASVAQALDVWTSSSTAAAQTTVQGLCVHTGSYTVRAILHGVCTDFAVASSSLTIANSSWTVTGVKTIGPVGTTVEGACRYYDTPMPAGLSYFKNNTAAVTILYRCY